MHFLTPHRHVSAAKPISQGSSHGSQARLRGVPRVRIAGVEHLLMAEVLPATAHSLVNLSSNMTLAQNTPPG